MSRIVSLIASATEIVSALGADSRLVGRSHECDYPESITHLPVCTEPKFNTAGGSYEIDQRVKALLQDALSVYRVDTEQLQALRPDLILTQAQCEVCAVSLKDVEQAVCDWLDTKPRILSLSPTSLGDVFDDITRVADALGMAGRGASVIAALKDRMATVMRTARAQSSRPTTACIEWINPLMAAGNWTPELVEMAGGRDVFGTPGHHAPWISWEALREADPEVIILMPCGFDRQRTRADAHALTDRQDWSRLRAVQAGQVYVTDGNQYFNRSGPRLIDSLEILGELLHPSAFRYGYQGTGWERL